jgi:RHS repeat-associated protein
MKVEPVNEYTYDAIYRLIEARGRENDSALDFKSNDNWNDIPKMKDHQPGDPMAVVPYTESYIYDKVGNIMEINHVGSWQRINTYKTDSNRLESSTVAGITFQYTHHLKHGFMAANNLLENAMPHLEDIGWNFKEEVIHTIKQRVTNGGTAQTTYYQYDGQGQRIRKITENSAVVNSDATRKDERIYIAGYETYRKYKNDTVNEKIFERESLSLMDKEHRFVMIETVKEPYALPAGELSRGMVRYQLQNHLGSTCLELDKEAKVISYEEYHPYGTTAYQVKNKTITCAAKRYRYTGMERDEETGLEYHSARYYLPWLGRWLSADPILLNGGINFYCFCRNAPIRFLDINGCNSFEDLFKYLRDNAGFIAADMPKGGPPQFSSAHASPFGTAGHQEITNLLDEIKGLGQAGFKNIENVYSEVAVQHGTNTITKIGGSPIKGHHNLDLVGMPNGQPLSVNNTLAPGSATLVGDAKFGGGSITTAHSQFGQQAVTVNGASASTPGPSLGAASETEQMFTVLNQELASNVKTAGNATSGTAFNPNTARATWAAIKQGKSVGVLKSAVNAGSKVLGFVGNVASVAEAGVAGYQVGTGINSVANGEVGKGATDIIGGSTQLGIAIGVPAAVKAGVVVGGGAGALALVSGLAAASVGWAVEDTKRALNGEKTMTDESIDYWSKNGITKTFEDLIWQIKN